MPVISLQGGDAAAAAGPRRRRSRGREGKKDLTGPDRTGQYCSALLCSALLLLSVFSVLSSESGRRRAYKELIMGGGGLVNSLLSGQIMSVHYV